MNCLFCNELIAINRKKYCSIKCIKRAWYLRSHPNTKSYFSNNPDFWKTETGRGFKWEKWVAKKLGAKHLEFNSRGADLDWDGKLVDVKSKEFGFRRFKRGKMVENNTAGWTFNRGKKKKIDFFFCICLKKNKPIKILLIPDDKFPNSGICVGVKSKYDIYLFSPYH